MSVSFLHYRTASPQTIVNEIAVTLRIFDRMQLQHSLLGNELSQLLCNARPALQAYPTHVIDSASLSVCLAMLLEIIPFLTYRYPIIEVLYSKWATCAKGRMSERSVFIRDLQLSSLCSVAHLCNEFSEFISANNQTPRSPTRGASISSFQFSTSQDFNISFRTPTGSVLASTYGLVEGRPLTVLRMC